METVYLETTVISYLVSQPSRDVVVAAHQQMTRQWWAGRRASFLCVVSDEVMREVSLGDATQSVLRAQAVAGIAVLLSTPPVRELARRFLLSKVLPSSAASEALHLAIAVHYRTDYLLTWNCRHLANAEILGRLERIVRLEGGEFPRVCTPLELMGC